MPDWKHEIRRRLAELKLEPTREAEIVEELAQHLDDWCLRGNAIKNSLDWVTMSLEHC